MSELVNLTSHPVVLLAGASTLTIAPSGVVGRALIDRQPAFIVESRGCVVEVSETSVVAGEPLPLAQVGTFYVVSELTARAWPHRRDLVFPDELVRDLDGRVIGCRGLALHRQASL